MTVLEKQTLKERTCIAFAANGDEIDVLTIDDVKEWLQQIRVQYEKVEDAPELVTEDLRLIDELLEKLK